MDKGARSISLIVGADSTIGHALACELSQSGHTVVGTTRRKGDASRHFLDLSQKITDWEIPGPVTTAYFCAAVTSLQACREAPEHSAKVNVHNTVALAKRLIDQNAHVVFLSTNLVYNGDAPFVRPDTPVCPQTEYGKQKAEAETLLLSLGSSVSILRLTKVVHPELPLLTTWTHSLNNLEIIHPFSDFVMAPVSLPLAVKAIQALGLVKLPGIMHLSASRDITYEQVGVYLAKRLGVNQDLVQPVRAREVLTDLEAIPSNTTLDTRRLEDTLGFTAPDPWAAIDTFVFSSA